MDEDISGFAAITDASPQIARHFLSMTGGNLEQAIQLYFDNPDLSSGMGQDAPPTSTSLSSRPNPGGISRGRTDSSGVVHLDSDDEDVAMDEAFDDSAPQKIPSATASTSGAAYEDDEAMARRMQEEIYGSGDMSGGFGAESVRAPLARTTETLVGPGADWGGATDIHDEVLQQLRARQQPRPVGRPGVFNQQAGSSSIWDESNPAALRETLAQATGGASEANSKAAKLAELFRPPFELMSRLPWDDAREKGKEEEKWIIVNIQDPSIFDCQALNRDIWKNEGVKETVKENFIFMQYAKDDPKGSQYIQYYFPLRDSDAAYPHIAIVDPRTGEQVKVWSGPPVPKAGDFLMQLHEFLDRYSLNAAVRNPVARRKPEKSASLDVDRLTEEQMLDIALQRSLANGGGTGPKDHDPDDLTKSIGDLSEVKGKGKEVMEDITNTDNDTIATQSAETPYSIIASDNPHSEPPNDPASTTRIQFRHSSGRVIRRFKTSDSIRRLYEWLKADPIEGKAGIPFELKSMGRDLIESLDSNISDAGLKNGTVMIEFLED